MTNLSERLTIPTNRLDEINAILLDPKQRVISDFLAVVEKYGTPEEINAKHREARKLENLLKKVEATKPEHLTDLHWLIEQRDRGAFVSVADYRKSILGEKASQTNFADDFAITLEASALQSNCVRPENHRIPSTILATAW